MPDAEYTFAQTISKDSNVLKEINTDDNPYELSIDITAAGYAEGSISPGHWQFQQFLMQLFIHTAQLTCYEKSSILFLEGSVKKITL